MKRLLARKAQDGYIVEIKDIRILKTYQDVLDLIRQEGLKLGRIKNNGRILAD